MANPEPTFIIAWTDAGEQAQKDPDPRFPSGIDVNAGDPRQGCSFPLPYPAPRIGAWIVQCNACGMSVAVSAAGRRDDPRSVRVPCKGREEPSA